MYKIRNKDGLFSTGGGLPKWNERGKVWKLLSHISSHLGTDPFSKKFGKTVYDGTEEIVEYEMIEIAVIPLVDHVEGQMKRREIRNAKDEARLIPQRIQRLRDEEQRLQDKLSEVKANLGKLNNDI